MMNKFMGLRFCLRKQPRKMIVLESIFHFFKMTKLFNAIRSPEGATHIQGCYVGNEQSRNARCSFRATFA